MNSYCPKGCAAAAIPGLFVLWILIKRGNFEEMKKERLAENSS